MSVAFTVELGPLASLLSGTLEPSFHYIRKLRNTDPASAGVEFVPEEAEGRPASGLRHDIAASSSLSLNRGRKTSLVLATSIANLASGPAISIVASWRVRVTGDAARAPGWRPSPKI